MKRFRDECVTSTADSSIKFEEKKKVMVFRNPERKGCLKVKVDGCQITEGPKCDHLLVEEQTANEYFVELKGVNVGHALEQLDVTMSKLSDKGNQAKRVKAFVVCTNVAPQASTVIQKYQKKFRALHHADLLIRERRGEVTI